MGHYCKPLVAEHTQMSPMTFSTRVRLMFLVSAIVTAVGVVAICMGHTAVGAALVFTGVGSMVAAAAVLLASSPEKARAAVTQGTFALIAVVLLALGLAT